MTCRCRSLIPALSVGSLYSLLWPVLLEICLECCAIFQLWVWDLRSSLAVGSVQVTQHWMLALRRAKHLVPACPPWLHHISTVRGWVAPHWNSSSRWGSGHSSHKANIWDVQHGNAECSSNCWAFFFFLNICLTLFGLLQCKLHPSWPFPEVQTASLPV